MNMRLVAAVAVAALIISAASFLYDVSDHISYTTTVTKTVTTVLNRTETGVRVLSSVGDCGNGNIDRPTLELFGKTPVGGGFIVTLVYRENASTPCYRHYVKEAFILESYPPRIHVKLGLEATAAEVCVQCFGVVTTLIQIDAVLPAGTVIVVNGLSVVV